LSAPSSQPPFCVNALDEAPSHLIFQKVHVLAGGDLQLHAVADDVKRGIEKKTSIG
jgi:hypothetical protein